MQVWETELKLHFICQLNSADQGCYFANRCICTSFQSVSTSLHATTSQADTNTLKENFSSRICRWIHRNIWLEDVYDISYLFFEDLNKLSNLHTHSHNTVFFTFSYIHVFTHTCCTCIAVFRDWLCSYLSYFFAVHVFALFCFDSVDSQSFFSSFHIVTEPKFMFHSSFLLGMLSRWKCRLCGFVECVIQFLFAVSCCCFKRSEVFITLFINVCVCNIIYH